jgi:uncharacterized membrane protein YhaH (DUF805 family)
MKEVNGRLPGSLSWIWIVAFIIIILSITLLGVLILADIYSSGLNTARLLGMVSITVSLFVQFNTLFALFRTRRRWRERERKALYRIEFFGVIRDHFLRK